MPKMKTKRAAAKRYSLTGTGKVKFKRTRLRHLLEARSKKMKKQAGKAAYAHPSDQLNARKLIPYA